jgi:signal transduction histidine kinase/FixJ family two-component response regulator
MRAAGRALFLALVPVLVLVSLAALLTLHFSDRLGANRALVTHTFEVIGATRTLLADIQDAETGQRGFIITERPDYLEPYRAAQAEIPEHLATLRRLTADNEQQARRVTELDGLVGAKLVELRRTVELSQRGEVAAARAEVLSDRGKMAMEDIRRLVGEIVAAESAMAGQHLRATDEAQRNTLYAAMAGSVLGLGALVAGTVLLLRRNRRLRHAERELSRQGILLQATLDNCRDGIAAFDGTGSLVAFNRRFFDQLDFPLELAQRGRALADFQAIDRQRPCQAFADPGPSDDLDAYQQLKVGARHLELHRSNMPAGGFVVSSLDVTRRLQAETIVRQAQEMEAIGRLTGGVAHDFNNLLQVIGSNLELLARDLPRDGEAAQRLGNAMAGAERGARLTGQLLAFARRQPLDPRVLNLGRVVREMTDLLQRTLGERIAVEAVVAGGLWNTLADPGQVENAILNLAINARDAMAEHGGRLTIEVANASLDDAYAAQHPAVTAGQYVLLAASDTGTGMSAEVAAQVFEPFFTTKLEGQGTGLGLSQVYGFVKQTSGHIKLYSELGHGTTVKLYLPRSRRPEEAANPDTASPSKGGSESVLVVEDDLPVRLAVVDLLNDLGYQVLIAGGAEAALAILGSGAQVDLLFTDVVMPGPISTRELARRAQEMHPGLAVLYTSGYTENAIIHDGRLDEDVLLLSKPYRRDDLARRVRLALANAKRRQRAASAAVTRATSDGRHTVLVVEDDELVRLGTVDMVRQLGHDVAEAASGYAALELLRQRPEIDVVITDLGLPGMSGQELMTAARELRPELPILVATGYAAADLKREPQLADKVILLLKPFLADDLRKALADIDRAIAGR